MQGSIVGDIDVAQIMVVIFGLFFFGLVLYLRREDKREGYPLKDPAGGADAVGFPPLPEPKSFLLPDGRIVLAPRPEEPRDFPAAPLFAFPGAPITPTGDPLLSGVGPGAFALRKAEPTMYNAHERQMQPLRTMEPGWSVVRDDPDPRGMTVIGRDGQVAGMVRDFWMDRGVKILRYLEVELTGEAGRVLLPIYFTDIKRKRGEIRVSALRAAEFAKAPRLAEPDIVTAREEDQINAFYAGGRFFGRQDHEATLA